MLFLPQQPLSKPANNKPYAPASSRVRRRRRVISNRAPRDICSASLQAQSTASRVCVISSGVSKANGVEKSTCEHPCVTTRCLDFGLRPPLDMTQKKRFDLDQHDPNTYISHLNQE